MLSPSRAPGAILHDVFGYAAFRVAQAEARSTGRFLGIGFANFIEPAPFMPSLIKAIGFMAAVSSRPATMAPVAALGTMALAFGSATGTGDSISLPGAWGPAALVAANVFVISFGASWGPLVWVLLGEIFPSRIRARALGLAAAAEWLAAAFKRSRWI